MTEQTVFDCDSCGERFGALNWLAGYSIVKGARSRYQKPRKETLHACIQCYSEYYDHVDVHEDHQRWCWDHEMTEDGTVRHVTGMLVSKSRIESTFEFVPREEFNEDEEAVATFLEEELI